MTRVGKEELADMDEVGERIKARREQLGMEKVDLAQAAGIHRNTLAAIETGESFNRSTLLKIERALDAAEEEAGIGAPATASTDPRVVTIRGSRSGDIDVVVSGSIDDLEALTQTVERLLRTGGKSDEAASESDQK